MLSRSNKHIKKFNQLVEVYEPKGVEPLETVTTRDETSLENRKAEISDRKRAVERLDSTDFFDESRREEIQNTESMPEPSQVASSQKADMLDRLEQIERVLADAIADDGILDTAGDLDF